jgi:hypothetical protein
MAKAVIEVDGVAKRFGATQALMDVSLAVEKGNVLALLGPKDGYTIEGEPCVQEAAGAMGIDAVNATLAGDLTIDPLRPEVLLYLPDPNGNLKLVGVEYFAVALTPTGPWFGSEPPASGFVNPAPSVFGQTFDGPMPGHNPSMPWHYDLHVWLWADNPSGLFAPFSPALSCS